MAEKKLQSEVAELPPFDILKFIAGHLETVGIPIDPRFGLKTDRSDKAVMDEAFLCHIKEAGKQKLSRDLFDTNFRYYLESEARKATIEFLVPFAYGGADLNEIKKITKCLGAPDIYADVFAHWMWLVKSSMFYPERRKYHHLMPVVVGPQGAGKSTLIDSLISPLKPYSMYSTIEEITDSRVQIDMCRSFAVFLDEMAKFNKDSMNAVKRVLTMTQTSLRALYSNSVKSHINRAVFIGASNKRIIESLYDPTGMRRFIEIQIFKPIDWDILKTVDFNIAWKSIDENLERGYMSEDLLAFVKLEQSKYVDTEPFDDFITFYGLNKGESKSPIKSTKIYKCYLKWCAEESHRFVLDHKPFGRKLMGANIDRIHKMDGSYYLVNKLSRIWDEEEVTAESELGKLRMI